MVGDNEVIQIVCKKKESARPRREAEEVGGPGKGDKRMNLRGGASKVSHQSDISQVISINNMFLADIVRVNTKDHSVLFVMKRGKCGMASHQTT